MKRRRVVLATAGLAGELATAPLLAATPCPPPRISTGSGTTATTACGGQGGTSALAGLAASMAPGTWARLDAAGQDVTLGVGSISGTMLHYCNTMPWNPVSGVIEILAMDHNYPTLRHARYVESSNRFVLVADDAGLGTGTSHGYDHNAVNPHTGDLYHRRYGGFSGSINVARKALGSANFAPIASVAGMEQVAIGACWWSGAFAGAGSQGCFMLFNSGNAVGGANDGHILAYDPLNAKWFYSREGRAPGYGSGATYHSVIEYSAKRNLAVYGGGNAAPRKLWRLNADGSFNRLTDVPAGKGVGMQQGILVEEPVSGNFLLLSAGELWELDPRGSGAWRLLTAGRVPPAGVGVPGPSNPQAVIASSIASHGVVAFVTQPQQDGGSMYLYKHA